MTPDQKYAAAMVRLGYQLNEFKIGGNYTPLLRDGNHVYISGQIPRVGDAIVLPGKVGASGFCLFFCACSAVTRPPRPPQVTRM